MLDGDSCLLRRRHRHSPAAIGDLSLKKLWRHGGFAMGRQRDAGRGDERAHPAAVMIQGRLLEDGDGKGQIASKDVPILFAEIGNRYRAGNPLIRSAQ